MANERTGLGLMAGTGWPGTDGGGITSGQAWG
jgi:hypothetical protein